MALVLVFGLLPATAFAAEGESTTPAVYVSSRGNDGTGDGSVDKPYATLLKAVTEAENGATVYVMSDLTMTECARFDSKSLTITSDENGPYTVTRGSSFKTQSDNARSWYNPAMIEVQTDSDEGAGLTLKNIIFDDNGTHEGTVFAQAVSDGSVGAASKDNPVYVQDAIIASNATVPSTITLGKGAVLQNFGGMSAVRVTEKAKLVMESGSKIEDTTVTDRVKGPSGSVGPAGAIWVQGGEIDMQDGAVIENVVGRAIYADGGTATINGTISNIKSDADMWNGCQGVAIHLRNCATASVGGTIQNVKSTDNNSVIIRGENSSFTLEQGATIQNCEGTGESGYGGLIYMNLQKVSSQELIPSFTLNGTITECASGGTVIYTVNSSAPVLIGENAKITNNKGQKLFYENAAADFEAQMVIGGTITNNVCSVLFYGSNNGRPVILTDTAKVNDNDVTSAVFGFKANRRIVMEAGSEICNNKVANGAVVAVNGEGNCFTMKGGSIFGNTVENGSLFAFTSGSWQQPSTLAIKGGTISNNTVSRMFTITRGGKVPGIYSYLEVSTVDSDTYFQQDGKTVTVNPGTKLGNADDQQAKYAWPDQPVGQNPRCVATLNAAAADYGWNSAFATFWGQSTNGTPVTVKMDAPAEGETPTFDTAKAVYALLLATDEKGAPESGAKIVALCAKVDAEGNISFNLPGNTDGYAVALVQPTTDYGTLTIAANPTSLDESNSAESYTVNYTATFQASTSLMEILNVDKETLNVLKFAPALDSRLKLNGEVSAPTVSEETVTWTFRATLNSNDFTSGESLFTGGAVSATIEDTNVVVPAVPAETQMVGLCTVTFDANGGVFSDGGDTKALRTVSGKAVTVPAAPTRIGYTFDGWNTATDGSGTPFTSETTVDSDVTVYAQWSKDTSGGGGSGGGNRKPTVDIPDDVPSGLNGDDHFAYIVGYPDGNVKPSGNITRAEVATIFFRLLTEDVRTANSTQSNSLSDVSRGQWFNHAISTLSSMGIVKGHNDGTFAPNAPITRAEFAAIAARFDDKNTDTSSNFSDIASHWAKDEIGIAANKGWINGYPDGTFRPNQYITRAEAMTLVNRMLNRLPENSSDLLDSMIKWPDNSDASAWYYLAVQEATNSHAYSDKSKDDKYEKWTTIRDARDWTELEK